jgi:hypothetical protein
MRMLMHVTLPHETFNAAVKDGTVESKMKRILEELKPEATYYTATRGHRSAYMIIDLQDPSQIPHYAEPWFLLFNADCEFHPVMVPEDLGKAGLLGLGKKWA